MSEISRSLCSKRVALWRHVILKQTAATASDERVGVKNLEVKIKRDSQVTKIRRFPEDMSASVRAI